MQCRAFYSNFDLTAKLGEIKEQNKGSKIYPQNQVILDCIRPSISLKTGLSHPFLGMGPGPMELGKFAAF